MGYMRLTELYNSKVVEQRLQNINTKEILRPQYTAQALPTYFAPVPKDTRRPSIKI